MDVAEAMTKHPITVAPEQSIADAELMMRRGRFRHLPVVAGGQLVGVVTERDFHASMHDEDDVHRNRPVRTVMTRDVITVTPSDPVEQAARLMLENKVGCLPVMDGDALVGIITESDIFRAFVQVLGVLEPGTRVQIRAPDLVAALERVAEVAQEQRIRVVSIVSEPPGAAGMPSVVVRFGTVMLAPLIAALQARGLDVEQPDPGALQPAE